MNSDEDEHLLRWGGRQCASGREKGRLSNLRASLALSSSTLPETQQCRLGITMPIFLMFQRFWRNKCVNYGQPWRHWFTLSLAGYGYNALQLNDEQIKSSWSEVRKQYQRRADLIPTS